MFQEFDFKSSAHSNMIFLFPVIVYFQINIKDTRKLEPIQFV